MKLSDLAPIAGSKKKAKRIGRGEGSGSGKTSGRGHKGQKARSGGGTRPGFEGGQMPLQRRLPKRGFTNVFKKQYSIVNVDALSCFEPDSVVDSSCLADKGLIKNTNLPVKLLGDGEVSHKLTVKVQAASKIAIEKITQKGGQVEILTV
ncbi:MAG: 50S ribosomal protein L15 [Deltaproteobacteria bacterium]|jgi:large subunit ribosomal protein L15|nr:50S ribosomal protein L15 [Deltaproteobacteria bacterium]